MAPAALVMGALLVAVAAVARVGAVWHSDAVMVNGQSVTCPCDMAPCRLWTAAEVVGGGAGVALSQPMCGVNAVTCAAGRGMVVTTADWVVGLVTKRVSLARCTAPFTWTSPWADTYAMSTAAQPTAFDVAWRQTAVPVGINSRDATAGFTLRLHCVRCGGGYDLMVADFGVHAFYYSDRERQQPFWAGMRNEAARVERIPD